MKLKSTLYMIIVASLLATPSCAHMSDPCDNKLLQRIPSPNGSLVLATYHRECRSMIYTMATVEKPPGIFGTKGEEICYVMSWRGRHPVEAVWNDGSNVSISTTDRLEPFDVTESKDSCSYIKLRYHVQFRNTQQETDDQQVIAKIKSALSDVGPCINSYYQAAYPTNDPAGYISQLIERGEHRSAVELILGYAADARCSISPETYAQLKELSETFDLKPEYLQSVEPLVKR